MAKRSPVSQNGALHSWEASSSRKTSAGNWDRLESGPCPPMESTLDIPREDLGLGKMEGSAKERKEASRLLGAYLPVRKAPMRGGHLTRKMGHSDTDEATYISTGVLMRFVYSRRCG
ncbi:hypothetical protein ACOMHN_043954 [Nucella lapillus]